MKRRLTLAACFVIQWFIAAGASSLGASPLVIAHRGASGYLPEHTLEAAAFAYAAGAHAIEQDVVVSRDGHLIVIHDIHLDAVTDVSARYPARSRPDGRFCALDFDLREIRALRVNERVKPNSGEPVFPERFPVKKGRFQVATLSEHLELIQGLNKSTGRTVAVYVEFKAPQWHLRHGYDIGRLLVEELGRHGYRSREDPAFVQCFDPAALRRLRDELHTDLRLVQLIGDNARNEGNADFDDLRTEAGLRQIAAYADGIGPALHHVCTLDTDDGEVRPTGLAAVAHRLGLLVHPYTLRADQLPWGVARVDQAHEILFEVAKVDGIFSDFPDQTVRWIERNRFGPPVIP